MPQGSASAAAARARSFGVRGLLAVTVLVAASACRDKTPPPPAAPPLAPRTPTTALQGLTGPQRDSLHHLGEGDEFMPVTWIRSLRSVATGKLFLEDIERFGMLPDPDDSLGFPIGLSATKPSDVGARSNLMVGFSCAACHTAQLVLNGKPMIIEGGSALSDPQKFERELVASIMALLKNPKEAVAFVKRVNAQPEWLRERQPVSMAELPKLIASYRARFDSFRLIEDLLKKEPRTDPGYGRIDAFNTARNMLYPKQGIALTAPVRHPKIWQFDRHTWLHWDGNTNSVMERNIGQSIAAGAIYVPSTGATTLLPQNLSALQVLASLIQPPKWPAELAGSIDEKLAAAGKPIYVANCERCHATPDKAERDTLIPYREIGTDPQRGITAGTKLFNQGYAVVAGRELKKAKLAAYKAHGITDSMAHAIEGARYESKWRVTGAYAARPLTSIWATAPYFHNGSVPSLHDVLLPPAQRPVTFVLGAQEFDPVKVGITGTPPANVPPFTFDTRKVGNSNAGHLFGTTLSDVQRRQLLEYLKTL
ncbi:MAG: di-heme-cytochrome C peroxidase [Gemmatimonadaceae bacterium]